MPKTKNLDKIISDAESIGIVNKTKVRNIEIRRKFREMREQHVKYDDALLILAHEHFLSISSIQQIISGYKNNDY